jgi:glutamate racemase
MTHSIGIFDSGFGGLTVFRSIKQALPQYDYIYLGDNARAPYGNRSFEAVYEYTLECVKWLHEQGCSLVILACNTASAKALRTIQQNNLPTIYPPLKVLGVIRPTAEVLGSYTETGHIGILATQGTVKSDSYKIELHKFFPNLQVFQQACPLWVPFIESGAFKDEGVDYYIQQDVSQLLQQSSQIDTVLMACTHYPVMQERILKFLPQNVRLIGQGDLVAASLKQYLFRHKEITELLTMNGTTHYFTTDDAGIFDEGATIFMQSNIQSTRIHL